jgi:hypothetical protein
MLNEVKEFENLLAGYFEVDDLQQVELVIAVAASHKIIGSEMLWLRVIGASGAGKTEMLRTLADQRTGYTAELETITASSIRRGYVSKDKKVREEPTLLQRINGKLVITKEFAGILTKDEAAQKEVFGLLRSVHDGSLDADYGGEQGHIRQDTNFNWILGTTPYVEKVRQLEYQLGSRFVDLKWNTPIDGEATVRKAIDNDGHLPMIRGRLTELMGAIIANTKICEKPNIDYIPRMADIAAKLRSPVERDRNSREIVDLPSVEAPTRMGQSLARVARGLMMIGIDQEDVRPYLARIVFDAMTKVRSSVIKAWLSGITKQAEIAARMGLNQSSVSHTIEDIKVVGWKDEWIETLNGGKQ